ncbi:MAG: ABC transporter permease [Pseudomonadota bacterium]
MTRTCLAALLSHWRRNPLQLFALLAGLALATGLWTGVQAINAEARASYDAAATTLGEGQFDQLVPREGDSIALETYVTLRRAGWLVAPIVEGQLNGVRLVGLDVLTAPSGLGAAEMNGAPALAAFGDDPPLFAAAEAAEALRGLAAVELDAGVAPGVAVGDISVVQRLLDREDLSRLMILPVQPAQQASLASVAPQLRVQSSQQSADVAQLTDSFHLNLTAFGLLSFAVGLFIVHSTIGLAFEQRRGMIRTLRSLGVSLRALTWLVVLEMLTLALIGAGLGVALGYFIAALLLPDVAATLRGLYGAQISGTLALRPEWWLSGLLITLLGAAFAMGARIWQIRAMPALASARPRAWLVAGAGRFRWLSLAAVALLCAAAVLLFAGTGLLIGFVMLGCLLLGAALALPGLFARAVSTFEQRARGPLAQWFWADTRQQLPGLSLALMALLLAVSANIGVSTMVSSFRLTFTGFLDQRLAPELFVETETAEESRALQAFLDAQEVETLPLLITRKEIAGQPVRLYGLRVGPTYRANWVFLDETPDAWDSVAAGEAVVVNEQIARRAGLWVGDSVDVTPDLTLPIAAVVGDYGNPNGQVITSEAQFLRLYPDAQAMRFGLRTDDVAGLRQEITQEVGLPASAMINQAAIKSASLEVFERTFTVTQALNVLTLGVAGFAILMSLLTLADQRVPQLAPVWAGGVTRRQLGRLELLRALALAVLVVLLSLPLGLALAWVLLTVINVEAFGWQLPMFLFPLDYTRLGLYALIAAVLAAAWPALRLMRLPPAALLKVFAGER